MLSSGMEVFLIIQGIKAPIIGKKDLRPSLAVMLVERTNEKPKKLEFVLETEERRFAFFTKNI
jgi:hypothetical protein